MDLSEAWPSVIRRLMLETGQINDGVTIPILLESAKDDTKPGLTILTDRFRKKHDKPSRGRHVLDGVDYMFIW